MHGPWMRKTHVMISVQENNGTLEEEGMAQCAVCACEVEEEKIKHVKVKGKVRRSASSVSLRSKDSRKLLLFCRLDKHRSIPRAVTLVEEHVLPGPKHELPVMDKDRDR